MGNRLSFVDRGRTTLYSANNVNQYTAVTAPTSPPSGAWSYDLRGNLLSDGTQRHKWDLENRLLSSNRPGTKKVEYTYDSRSRRTTRTQNGNTTYYIYEGWNVIAEYEGSAGVLPSTTKRHIWGTDLTETLQGAGGVGGLLRTDFATSTAAYFHYDGNGNVTELTNKKGRRSARYRYNVFGDTIVARGKKSEDNQYHFSTNQLEEVTGIYHYGYRYYDPTNGRWFSRDPLGERGGLNLYRMINNNAIGEIDILGLVPHCGLYGIYPNSPPPPPQAQSKINRASEALEHWRSKAGGSVTAGSALISAIKNSNSYNDNKDAVEDAISSALEDVSCAQTSGTLTRIGKKIGVYSGDNAIGNVDLPFETYDVNWTASAPDSQGNRLVVGVGHRTASFDDEYDFVWDLGDPLTTFCTDVVPGWAAGGGVKFNITGIITNSVVGDGTQCCP